VRIDGIVTRGGLVTVWIKGHPLTAGQSIDGVTLLSATRTAATLRLPGRAAPLTLKAGQRWQHDRIMDGDDPRTHTEGDLR
jgi:hypothetical protein